MKNENVVNAHSVLFFDMDGTLVDTNYANFLSYKKAVERVKKSGFNFPYDSRERFNRSLLKKAIPELTETELRMIISEKERCYDDFLPETRLNNEIAEILYKYFRTNKTVLVTKCRKGRALSTLKYHSLTDKFSHLIFRPVDNGGEVNKFRNAVSSLRISPDSIIAFENEENEIADAQKAGILNINPLNI